MMDIFVFIYEQTPKGYHFYLILFFIWVFLSLSIWGCIKDIPNDPPSKKRWINWLKNNFWLPRYIQILEHFLEWLDVKLSRQEIKNGAKPTDFRRGWSENLLNFSLLSALIYPVLSIMVQWAIAGGDGRLGATVVIAAEPDRMWRWLPMLWLGAAAISAFLARWHSGPIKRILQFFAVAPVAAFPLVFNYVGPAALAFSFAFITSFAVAYSIALANAIAFAVAGGIAFFVVFSGVDVNILVPAVLAASTFAFIVFFLQDRLSQKTSLPAIVLATYVFCMLSIVIYAPRFVHDIDRSYAPYLVFIVIFPLINALADFGSTGLTRWMLRLGVDNWSAKDLSVAERARRPRPPIILLSIGDVFAAFAILMLLAGSLVWAIHLARPQNGIPLVDLAAMFADVRCRPGDYWWLYVTLFSTLAPTLIHAIIAFSSIVMIWPSFIRNKLIDWVERGDKERDVKRLSTFVLSSLIATPAIILSLFLYYGIQAWQTRDRLGYILLDRIEAWTAWLDPQFSVGSVGSACSM